jgi:peptide-methionine (S)-S-oxide reductase
MRIAMDKALRIFPNRIVWQMMCLLLMAGLLFNGAALAGETKAMTGKTATATFAGGCFWCMEPPYDKLDGVISTTSGYTGGHKDNPTYEEVSSGSTGHAEAIQVVYDPAKISYAQLLQVFWHNIDPTAKDAQFCDHGNQYRSAIFYHDDEQRRLAEESKEALIKSKKFPVSTRRSWPSASSIRPRITTRITIRRILSAISSTGIPAAATIVWRSCGAENDPGGYFSLSRLSPG